MSNLIGGNGILKVNDIYGTPFKVDLIPSTNRYRRLGIVSLKDWITNHNVGNSNEQADEDMHTKYVDTNIGYVNWHFTVGSDCIYQELPITEPAYHAGDGGKGKGNYNSIGIEAVEVPKAKWPIIRKNLIRLNVFLMNNVDSLIGDNWKKTIVPHQKWSGKFCPRIILNEPGGFPKFVNDCIEYNSIAKDLSTQLVVNNENNIDIKKLETKIRYNIDDNYWLEGFKSGTLSRLDIIWLFQKISGKTIVSDAIDVFINNKWSNDKQYWLNVVNGQTKYKRVFLNTIINRAINS